MYLMSAGTTRRPGPRTTSECARVAARAQAAETGPSPQLRFRTGLSL